MRAAARVLTRTGRYAANVVDVPPLSFSRVQAATVREVFADTYPARPFLGGQHLGALDLLAAVVSKWSGSRKHLATARPQFSALLARIENEPRVAPIFARHWPPAA